MVAKACAAADCVGCVRFDVESSVLVEVVSVAVAAALEVLFWSCESAQYLY